MKATKNSKRVEHLEPELEKMEEKYSREKDRLGKVFGIAEELDNDLRLAVTEMKARDDWYVDHMQIFEDLNKAIKERYEMIERVVEAERKSQHMSRAFTERVKRWSKPALKKWPRKKPKPHKPRKRQRPLKWSKKPPLRSLQKRKHRLKKKRLKKPKRKAPLLNGETHKTLGRRSK